MTRLPRVIPVLLISDGYLVKPVAFQGGKYIGDPINAVRIFNEKQVDELILCDIDASVKGTPIDFRLIEEVASEAFMPVAYGGGVSSAEEARRIAQIGIEKVIVNSALRDNPGLVTDISGALGQSSTVVSIDAKRKRFGSGWDTYTHRGSRSLGMTPVQLAVRAQELGAGELILSSIDRESSFSGYDFKLIEAVSRAVTIPVVALGGAQGFDDFRPAMEMGASAVAAGSMFVLNGKHRAVLISYPTPDQIRSLRLEMP